MTSFFSAAAPVALLTAALALPHAQAAISHQGKSVRVDHERLSLYRLEGSPFEIGYAVGRLAPPEAFSNGMVPYMSKFVQNTVMSSDLLKNNGWLRPLVQAYLDLKYYNGLGKRIMNDEQDFIKGLAKSTGLSHKAAALAFLNPDVSHVLIADYLQGNLFWGIGAPKHDKRELQYKPESAFGCSTFVVPGSQSADGKMLFARVQDYPGVGVFDAYPSVYYIAKPGVYRYVTIMTAGIAVGGVTAMNEHGLTLSVHSGLSLDAETGHSLLMSTTSRMMENARTIEDAVAICNRWVPAAGWIMNLADDKGGVSRMARVEVNPHSNRCDVDFQTDTMVTTNDYFREANRKREVGGIGPTFDHDAANRAKRVHELLDETYKTDGKVSLERAMYIMADRKDAEMNRYMSYAPAGVAALHQIAAVVFRPETREFWVSNGWAPPASNGHYVHFSFDDFADVGTLEHFAERKKVADIDIAALLKGTPNEPKASLYAYREAFHYYDGNGIKDPTEALNFVNLAVMLEPTEPIYRMSRGLLELGQGKVSAGVADLESVKDEPLLNAHRRHVAKLYLAKAYDALKRRDDALALYNELVADKTVYAKIKEAAENYRKKPCGADKLRGIDPDLRFIDTMNYD